MGKEKQAANLQVGNKLTKQLKTAKLISNVLELFHILSFFCTEKVSIIKLLHYWVFCQHWFSLGLLKKWFKEAPSCSPASPLN